MFHADSVGLSEVVGAITRYQQFAPAPLLVRLAEAGESFASFDRSN
jgi:hypothetical protein